MFMWTRKLLGKIRRLEENLKENMEREIRTLRDGMRVLNNQLDKVGDSLKL